MSFADTWKLEILATDVSRNALKAADRGIYAGRSLAQRQPTNNSTTHFVKVKEGYQVKPRLKKMVTFTQMNLASAVYVGRMDLIFCMNVLIYFSEERRRTLVQRFYESLEPGGYLFLGHSESISKMPVKFQAIVLNDCILYRKPTAEELRKSELVMEGRVSVTDRESIELFLQEASENLQYLREYVSVLQEIAPRREDLERLYICRSYPERHFRQLWVSEVFRNGRQARAHISSIRSMLRSAKICMAR